MIVSIARIVLIRVWLEEIMNRIVITNQMELFTTHFQMTLFMNVVLIITIIYRKRRRKIKSGSKMIK